MNNEPVSVEPPGLTFPILAERIAHEGQLREQARSYIERALELQAVEYERRLESLNGEAARLAKVLDQSVPREVFTNYVEAQDAKLALASAVAESARAELASQVTIERNARIRLEGSLGTWRFIAAFLGLPGLVALLLGLVAVFGPGK